MQSQSKPENYPPKNYPTKNIILYGFSPGTGKTFTLRTKYMQDFKT